MRIKKINIIIFIFVIMISIVLICSKSSDNPTLDEIKLKDNTEVSKKQFAMYTRDSEDSDYTKYTDENNLFPKGYKLNTEQSSCMDINGEDVTPEEVISQTEDGKIMVTSTKTVYCTFYFDKEPTASETLTTNPSSYLKEGDHGDLHWRYVGLQNQSSLINNYVCFGASDCKKEETNAHLYRIIGITASGNLKIQKNSSITPSQWYTSYQSDISWSQSTMYTTTLKSSFYNDGTYVSQDMKDKIDTTHKWNTGDVNGTIASQIGTGDTVYILEQQTKTHTGEIGLAYLSDYYYAYDENGNQNCYSNSPYCKSWMIPNDTDRSSLWSSQSYEWTMTRYGRYSNSRYLAWFVDYRGFIYNDGLITTYAVRPVFYLKSDIKISGGEGTLSSPFIIN